MELTRQGSSPILWDVFNDTVGRYIILASSEKEKRPISTGRHARHWGQKLVNQHSTAYFEASGRKQSVKFVQNGLYISKQVLSVLFCYGSVPSCHLPTLCTVPFWMLLLQKRRPPPIGTKSHLFLAQKPNNALFFRFVSKVSHPLRYILKIRVRGLDISCLLLSFRFFWFKKSSFTPGNDGPYDENQELHNNTRDLSSLYTCWH